MDKNKLKTKWDVLKALREFFEDPDISDTTHEEVWSILTGLRGPDIDLEAYETKEATTAVIRYRAFGQQVGFNVCADFNEDNPRLMQYRTKEHRHNHFWTHAKRAFDALGLLWNYTNPDSDSEENRE